MAVLDVLESQRSIVSEEGAAIVPLVVDGAERSFRQRTTPMRDADNRLVGAVMLLEDITHLREIDRLKSEFIATASHELRTPLTSLEMGVHLLLEGSAGALSTKQHELLALCREDTLRLDRLVKDLLELSRIESGKAVHDVAAVSPRELVVDAVEPLRRRVEAKGLTLRVDIPAELPEIAADRGKVERVITNLVTNAIRATDAGGAIDITAVRRDGFVAISVRDTGRGIPHDYLVRVFEPFVQVPDSPSGRSRPRPLDFAPYRAGPRWTDHGTVGTGSGHDVHLHIAGCRQRRRDSRLGEEQCEFSSWTTKTTSGG